MGGARGGADGLTAAADTDAPPSTRDLGGDYWRFLAGAALSNLGDGIRLTAMPLLAVQLTDSALLVSGVVAATMLPWLSGPFVGAMVDRVDRRRAIVLGQVGRGAAVLGFTVLLASGSESLAALYVVAVLVGFGEVVVDVALQASVPQLVDDALLERANAGFLTADLVLDQFVGTALGGILFAVATSLPFAVDAATFLFGAAVVATVRRPLHARGNDDAAEASSVAEQVLEGMRFVWHHPVLRGLAVAVMIANVALFMATSVAVILVVEELGAADETFGIVLAFGSVGGLVGTLLAERIARRFGLRPAMVGPPIVQAGALLVVAAAPDVVVVAGGLFVLLLAIAVYNVPGRTLRMRVTPLDLLGRVVAATRSAGLLGVPVGAVLAGVVTDGVGVRATFVVSAVLSLGTLVAVALATRGLDDVLADA